MSRGRVLPALRVPMIVVITTSNIIIGIIIPIISLIFMQAIVTPHLTRVLLLWLLVREVLTITIATKFSYYGYCKH